MVDSNTAYTPIISFCLLYSLILSSIKSGTKLMAYLFKQDIFERQNYLQQSLNNYYHFNFEKYIVLIIANFLVKFIILREFYQNN